MKRVILEKVNEKVLESFASSSTGQQEHGTIYCDPVEFSRQAECGRDAPVNSSQHFGAETVTSDDGMICCVICFKSLPSVIALADHVSKVHSENSSNVATQLWPEEQTHINYYDLIPTAKVEIEENVVKVERVDISSPQQSSIMGSNSAHNKDIIVKSEDCRQLIVDCEDEEYAVQDILVKKENLSGTMAACSTMQWEVNVEPLCGRVIQEPILMHEEVGEPAPVEMEVVIPLDITSALAPSMFMECGGNSRRRIPTSAYGNLLTEEPMPSTSRVGLHTFWKPTAKRSLTNAVGVTPVPTWAPEVAPILIPAPEGAPVPFPVPGLPPRRAPQSKRLRDKEIEVVLNFGSENEDDSDDELDCGETMVVIPRSMRMFYDEEEQEEDFGGNAYIDPCFPPTVGPLPLAAPPAAPADAPRALLGPTSKFEFQWGRCPQPPLKPHLRREIFTPQCGPKVALSDPYGAFTAIWDRPIMQLIVVETNHYAQQYAATLLATGGLKPYSRISKWRDTTVEELYVYFAVVIAMGTIVKTRLEEYWSSAKDIFSTPGFAAVMAYDRFVLLSTCLHFRDNTTCNPETMTRAQAKLFKVAPIVDHLNSKFQELYIMSQNIALDESLTMWKGWLYINQFIPMNVAKIGIKTYEVCESNTGYLWRFEVHAGHTDTSSPKDDPLVAFVPALVLRLLDGLEYLGYTVWMDNFYNSPALARELKCRGFDCVGTLRLNRSFVPVELATKNLKNMAMGQVCGSTSGDVDIVVWRDKKLVSLISTYHGLQTSPCAGTVKPTAMADYNVRMGGIDRKDQLLAMYPIERKRTRVWYKKLFKRLLNASVLNAHILLAPSEVAIQPISHRKFRSVLVNELLARNIPPPPPRPMIPAAAGHIPAQYGMTGPVHRQERRRRKCVLCKKRTPSYCPGCNKPMCVFICFERYHTNVH